jgi:hypothetical protein
MTICCQTPGAKPHKYWRYTIRVNSAIPFSAKFCGLEFDSDRHRHDSFFFFIIDDHSDVGDSESARHLAERDL